MIEYQVLFSTNETAFAKIFDRLIDAQEFIADLAEEMDDGCKIELTALQGKM